MMGCQRVLGVIAFCILCATPLHANDFDAWLKALRAQALQEGIQPATLDAALADIEPIPRVIELDRKQPEGTFTFAQYLKRVLPPSRVRKGQELLQRHQELLQDVSERYGVPPQVIVALWGVESDFGRLTGGFPVIASLATLAHDGRRSAFFRKELLNALKILDAGHIAPQDMTGSWAGAMGQSQFMPSSFLSRAVDHDGDGRRDIWTTLADVFASTANYLSQAGWRHDMTWGHEVVLPDAFDPALLGLKVKRSLAEWHALGVRGSEGNALSDTPLKASIVSPSDSNQPAFLVFDNYRVFLKWNRSTYFALTVGQLSDRIIEK